jgi:hypothetical protein
VEPAGTALATAVLAAAPGSQLTAWRKSGCFAPRPIPTMMAAANDAAAVKANKTVLIAWVLMVTTHTPDSRTVERAYSR